ncbi:dihydrofolate reductase [Pseudomonadota bacterium]
MKFSIIAAADKKLGIGKDNQLPWRLKGDLKYFSETTTDAPEGMTNAVVMGSKTWDSLPEKHRPLKDRINMVLSRRDLDLPGGVILAKSLKDAFEKLDELEDLNEVFVIGGASVYRQAIEHEDAEKVYLTEVDSEFDCDAFFPEIPEDFKVESRSDVQEEDEISYRFAVYVRR